MNMRNSCAMFSGQQEAITWLNEWTGCQSELGTTLRIQHFRQLVGPFDFPRGPRVAYSFIAALAGVRLANDFNSYFVVLLVVVVCLLLNSVHVYVKYNQFRVRPTLYTWVFSVSPYNIGLIRANCPSVCVPCSRPACVGRYIYFCRPSDLCKLFGLKCYFAWGMLVLCYGAVWGFIVDSSSCHLKQNSTVYNVSWILIEPSSVGHSVTARTNPRL